MENIIDFIIEYIDIFKFVLLTIVSVVLFFKTGNKKLLEEVKNMMYRTENYQDTEKVKGQTFNQFKPVYRLNKSTNELELTDEVVDINELVNSCKDACLNALLERFMPCQTIEDVAQAEVNSMLDDLDIASQTANLATFYKEKFNLDTQMSNEDVFKFVKGKSEELKAKIELSKNGGAKNEEEVVEKGE